MVAFWRTERERARASLEVRSPAPPRPSGARGRWGTLADARSLAANCGPTFLHLLPYRFPSSPSVNLLPSERHSYHLRPRPTAHLPAGRRRSRPPASPIGRRRPRRLPFVSDAAFGFGGDGDG
ncbi:hypothetical protein GQ55_9G506300 [Panicum hallii var. hallii]|uniref:Uncharacterized protein n=1 Tax=Panicum hallii var. hallii TaxID=1504633 RepID=A0A2T7CDM5_9POAL|nr:hypothetical protein GQ55_9G506300 [Panicum hallii var. hallii]